MRSSSSVQNPIEGEACTRQAQKYKLDDRLCYPVIARQELLDAEVVPVVCLCVLCLGAGAG